MSERQEETKGGDGGNGFNTRNEDERRRNGEAGVDSNR